MIRAESPLSCPPGNGREVAHVGEVSRIEWTEATFNPWWGCAHVSAGCAHCYAEALARRHGHDVWGASGTRRLFGEAHWAGPPQPVAGWMRSQ